MKTKTLKIIGIILQAPLVLVVIVSFFISLYAAYYKLYGITYGSSIISGMIIALYFTGVYIMIRNNHNRVKQ